MNDTSILLAIDAGIARITLNRPDRINALNDDMHAELRTALSKVAAEPSVRVVILTGAGRGFCAGQDLSTRNVGPEVTLDLGAAIDKNYNPLVKALHALPFPVIAAVNGVAAGAGANLALACDLVIAAESAVFIQAFCKIGLMPDSGGTFFLPRLVGSARAMGLALTGERLSAAEAERWGLIWKCVSDAAFNDTVDALAKQLAAAPTRALAATKEALYASAGNTLAAQLDLERDLQRELGTSGDFREGVAAFAAKRAARFTGR